MTPHQQVGLAAKQILFTERRLLLPLGLAPTDYGEAMLPDNHPWQGRHPDVVLRSASDVLHVVTHRCDEGKRTAIVGAGVPTVQINLSPD